MLAIDTAIIDLGSSTWKAAHTSSTAKYQWAVCVGNQLVPLQTDTGQTFSPQHSGDFALIITEGNCSDTSACKSVQVVGVGEFSANNFLKLYPNPATSQVLIHCDEMQGLGELRILNLNGQLLYSSVVEPGKDHEINIQTLPKGVYLVRVRSKQNTGIQRLIKL